MYINNEERKAKIGIVSLSASRDNSIKLRFTYPKKKRNDLNVSTNTDEGWINALRIAQTINADIELGQFDSTLARYSNRRSQALEIASRQPNLLDLWETYKETSKTRVAATTIKKHWVQYERHYLGRTPKKLLELDKASEFVGHLLSRYSSGSILPVFSNCLNPSVNLAVKTGKIERNVYAAIPIEKRSKKAIEAYEAHEVKAIVGAFYSDEYVKPSSVYPHSYYAPMIDFISLVGCRPSECHALTWNDIKQKNDRLYIRFNKAYSQGILLPHTKTHETRLFPVNKQLKTLINTMATVENKHNLIFPSVSLGYVNQKTFNRRYWKVIVQGLIDDGVLEKALRSYSLRHSFITRLIREGFDIATVARLSGNSTEMICKHYLASKEQFEVPEL
ncbi:MAG: tyrosine-type recombinase/integrase [Cyanobacteria bacterium J06648_1]